MGASSPQQPYNYVLPNTQEPKHTPIYRSLCSYDKLYDSVFDNVFTLKEMLTRSAQKYPQAKIYGRIVTHIQYSKSPQEKNVQTRSIESFTYKEVYERANNLGKYILGKQLEFKEPVHGMRMIGIYSKNRLEWMIVDQACILYGLTTVPLYDTLGVENLTYCLNQTEITSLFVTSQTIQSLFKLNDLGKLATVISFDKLSLQVEQKIQSRKLTLLYFQDLQSSGKEYDNIRSEDIQVKPEDCFTFSYTSGTTGPPKGAMLSHKNFISSISNLSATKDLDFNQQDVHISYLPLPHVMERIVIYALHSFGAFSVFYSGNILKLKDDCQLIKPTCLVSVPRIFNRIVDGVRSRFDNEAWWKKSLINYGLGTKIKSMQSDGSVSNRFYDELIFSKVKESFGGRIKVMFSGSAPMDPKNVEFLKTIMSCPFIQAYGSTENAGLAFNPRPVDNTSGHVGAVSVGLEFRLADIEQMSYTSEDKNEEGVRSARGEIQVRGPMVFLGYYKLKEATEEAISGDGWLKTGDVGQIIPESNAMRIIDRKKNIFKLQQGEYVAAQKVENIYLKCNLIQQLFIHGDSTKTYAIAIIVPIQDRLTVFAADHGIKKQSYDELLSSVELRTHLARQLNNLGKKDGLHSFENAKNIHLEKQLFATLGIMTNTMKLQRFQARKHYQGAIEKLYEEGELKLKDK